MTTAENNMEHARLSIVIAAYNEEESLLELYKEVTAVLIKGRAEAYEIIFVNDGSSDSTEAVLRQLHQNDSEHVKVINLERNFGKALALKAGFNLAEHPIIITLDADLQDDPAEIPRFVAMIRSGNDLVVGWKKDRKDSLIKNSTSRIYNLVNSLSTGIHLHDHNCGFKAYRSEAAKSLPLYAQLHRYVPLLVLASGWSGIVEIEVNHRKRIHGKSKYGPSRFIYGITGLNHALILARKIRDHKSRPAELPNYQLKNILA